MRAMSIATAITTGSVIDHKTVLPIKWTYAYSYDKDYFRPMQGTTSNSYSSTYYLFAYLLTYTKKKRFV